LRFFEEKCLPLSDCGVCLEKFGARLSEHLRLIASSNSHAAAVTLLLRLGRRLVKKTKKKATTMNEKKEMHEKTKMHAKDGVCSRRCACMLVESLQSFADRASGEGALPALQERCRFVLFALEVYKLSPLSFS